MSANRRGDRAGRGSWNRGRFNFRRNASKRNDTVRNETNDSQQDIAAYFSPNCPYKGWELYFSKQRFKENNPEIKRIQLFQEYFEALRLEGKYKSDEIRLKGSFNVDVNKLLSNEGNDMKAWWNTWSVKSTDTTKRIKILSKEQEALEVNEMSPNEEKPSLNYPMIHARLVNAEFRVLIRDLKATHIDHLVTVRGTVVRVSDFRPYCTSWASQCQSCGKVQSCHSQDDIYERPTRCISRECRGRTFTCEVNSELTAVINFQSIWFRMLSSSYPCLLLVQSRPYEFLAFLSVQDDVSAAMVQHRTIPKTIEVELCHDLVDTCNPGDIVTITGIIKVSKEAQGRESGHHHDECLFRLYMQANSVLNNTRTADEEPNNATKRESAILQVDLSQRDYEAIAAIQEQQHLFRLIVNSLCPAIYGHEIVKAGLVLGLFGGRRKYADDKDRVQVRGDPHVLVVGDPGLGKSQLLQACASVSPREVYVCANTSSKTGLSVTLCKQGQTNSIQAGALTISDMGCCCIDEFDKMGAEQEVLLQAMEQQVVSIAKSGVVCSFPTRSSILAAANPAGGHYNKTKTVSENLKISRPLLSRFDLIFILLDKPDEEIDSKLSEHIFFHRTKTSSLNDVTVNVTSFVASQYMQNMQHEADDMPLSERLKFRPGEEKDLIPHQLLKKYIGYARCYVHPKITKPAGKILTKFYVELRKLHHNENSTPITLRQMESLIRLSEARARLELREVVTENDAKEVIEIMKHSMIDVFWDQIGIPLDSQRSQSVKGSGMSTKNMALKFISMLTLESERTNNSLFTMQRMRDILRESQIQVQNVEAFIDSLNNQGHLIQKGPRLYQFQTQ